MGAEAEVRRERKGAGWAEEGRRGVGGLVERGSGAVWRYAGCLCGLSRGLIRYDSPGSLAPMVYTPVEEDKRAQGHLAHNPNP